MNSGENNSKKIAIFVSHRIDLKSMVIDNPLYVPVRCGADSRIRRQTEIGSGNVRLL